MKKFFKILRKIIKILLKSILWLILGIIVILGIILAIINNKTLKFYENDDGNIRFTMNEDFVIKKGVEFKINITDLEFSLKNLGNGYLEDESNIKLNLSNISMIRDLYAEGKFENFYDEVLPYYVDFHLISYYDNGLIENKVEYIHGFKKGYLVNYFENGQISDEAVGNNGILESTGYYKNGKINYIRSDNKFNNVYFETGYYENGIISYINNSDGYSVSYYNNGNIKDIGYLKDGYKTGVRTGYYIDGNILSVGIYDLSGDYLKKYFDKNGNIFGTGENINGINKGLIIFMHDNGQIDYTLTLDNGIGTGYYENGDIGFIGNNINGYLTGENFRYYINSLNLRKVGIYDGKGNGDITYYDENRDVLGTGKIINNETFDGLYVGFSWKDGQLLEKGNYINGEPDGYRVEYFEDGQIYSEGNYDNGKRVGVRNWYLGDGSIGVSKNYDE